MTAVIVDLDDTLYPQSQFLSGAFDAVARAAATAGLDGALVRDRLDRAVAVGSDTGRVITDALGPGVPRPVLALCVAAFRAHRPDMLEPYPGVREALARLARRHRIGILTDGNPPQQRAKLAALRLGTDLVVMCSDELGRSFRKPHSLPFRALAARLGSGRATVIGDRPDKDIAGAVALGWPCVRVRTGEWSRVPTPSGVPETDDFAAAVDLVLDGLTVGDDRSGADAGDRGTSTVTGRAVATDPGSGRAGGGIHRCHDWAVACRRDGRWHDRT